MDQGVIDAGTAAFRRFNRFYTRVIGALSERHLESPFALAEARILFELASRAEAGVATYASDLREELGLDGGYLSRLLARFEGLGYMTSRRSEGDARRRSLLLEPKGWDMFRELDKLSGENAKRILSGLKSEDMERLVAAFATVERLLGAPAPEKPPVSLEEPGPGDLGWVVLAHGEIYSREYVWGAEFEALVARIVADFASCHDPERERAWIARAEGRRLGSVFLVRVDESTAKLRLLLLTPEARGLGLGRRLVDECLAFARAAGYARVVLWTNETLTAARAIYAKAGFRLAASEPETKFGTGTMSETWELALY